MWGFVKALAWLACHSAHQRSQMRHIVQQPLGSEACKLPSMGPWCRRERVPARPKRLGKIAAGGLLLPDLSGNQRGIQAPKAGPTLSD
jgi:hypothetical protein